MLATVATEEGLPPMLQRVIEGLVTTGTTIGGAVVGGPIGAVAGAGSAPVVTGLISGNYSRRPLRTLFVSAVAGSTRWEQYFSTT
jgi:hypothetical protein